MNAPDPRLTRRILLGAGAAGLAGVVGLGAAGCSTTPVAQRVRERHRDGILRIGIASAPSNINPLDSGSEVTRWIAEPVVETLYEYDEEFRSVPLLADGEPEISEDGLEWRIRVRQGITFQNGDELTANDVVATLAHVNDLGAGSEWITYLIGYVQSYSALDAYTVSIKLSRPYGLLRSHLTNLPIVHRDYVGRKDAIMGTGPFRLDDFSPGQTFRMSRYDRYHGRPSAFQGIQYTVFQDGATRLISLRQGKVDLITAVPFHNIDSARSNSELHVSEVEATNDVLFYYSMGKEPFNDPDFRAAVSMATDRLSVVNKVFGGAAVIGQGPIGPAERGYVVDLTKFAPEPDFEAARERLERAATSRRDFKLTISTNQISRDMAQVLVAGYAKIGLDVSIEMLTGGPWSNKLLDRSYDLIMNVFQSGFTSGPANFMTMAPGQSTNVLACGFADPECDELMTRIWETEDEQERTRALSRVNEILLENDVITPPVYPKLVLARRQEVSPFDETMLRISRIQPQKLHFVDREV